MKHLTILLTLAVLLGGCVVVPYGPGGEGDSDGSGDWHEHHHERGEGRDEGRSHSGRY